jgi:hypothetical protein
MGKQAQAQQPQQAQQVLPGGYFDFPGIPTGSTAWTEQDENTVASTQALASGNSVQLQTVLPMKQTDVVADWIVNLNVTQTYTAGTSIFTPSAYAPLNAVGPVKLDIQNQYASIDVLSGIDWYIFNIIRPYRNEEATSGVNVYSNPAGAPIGGSATGYLAAALAQPMLINSAQWTTGLASYNLLLRLPAAQWFDNYFDLTLDGTPTALGHPALVSPQYMAGTTRVITPKITMAQMAGGQLDSAPVNIGAGTGTAAGSVTARVRRKALYANGNPAVMPPAYAWQYRWKSQQFAIGAVSQRDIPLPPDSGQVLSLFVRLWDPAANGGLGAPISLANLARVNFQFGSGLLNFDAQTVGGLSAGALLQKRWLETHDTLLPAGVFALDLALDERGQMSNKRALNVLTTSGCQVHMEFTGTQSVSAYAVLGVESLVYVS